jgi:predicted nucleotidyltransferase
MSRKRSRGYGFEVQGVKAGDPAPGTSTAPWELDVEQLPNKRRQADSKAMEHAWLGFRNGGRQQRQWAKHQQPVQQPLPVVQLPKNAVQPAPVVPTVQGFQSSFSVQSYAFPATATSSTQQQSTAPAKPKKNRELEPRGVEIVVNDTVIGSYVREPRKQKQESPQAKKQKVQKPQPEQQNSGERCQSANAWREIIPDMFQAGPSSNSSVIVLRDVVVSNRRSRVEALRGLFARLGDGLSVSREQIRGGGQAVVSSAIWDDYRSNAETRQSFNEKLDFWIAVDGALEREFGSNCRSHVFGSTLSGFGSKESDVDLCVFAYDGMAQAAARLQKVRKLLRRYFRDAVSPNIELIPAKVPLLKFYYYNLEVDVSCNNEMGTRNTHLLYCYGQV